MVFAQFAGLVKIQTMPNRIREHRTRLGWSLEKLASESGTSPQQVSRLERSERGLDDKWLTRLAAAMGVGKADLLENAFGAPGSTPSAGDFAKDGVERSILDFWRNLSPETQDIILSMIDAWADRIAPKG